MTADDNLARQLEQLTERVAMLEDHLAVAKLMASYGPNADSGDPSSTSALWVEQGLLDVGHARYEGAEQIKAAIDSDAHHQFTSTGGAHIVSAPLIEVDGDRAVGTCYQQLIAYNAEDGGYREVRVSANRWEMVRTSQGWKILNRWNRALDGSRAALDLLAAAEFGAEHGRWSAEVRSAN